MTDASDKLKRRDVLKGAAATAIVLQLPGCPAPSETDAGTDAGRDAMGRDAPSIDGGPLDAGLDAGMDAGRDAGTDASDAGTDAGEPDAPSTVTPPESVPLSTAFLLDVASGDPTSSAAILWTRHDGTTALEVVVYEMAGDSYAREAFTAPASRADGYVHVEASGLSPATRYRYAFFELTGADRTGRSEVGRFETAPADDALVPVTFGAVSCVNNARPIGTLGDAATRTDLSFFCFLGDSTYNDGARTLAQYRTEWESNVRRPEYRALRAATGAFATWDDHEFDNDFNPETFPAAQLAAAKQAFFEHLPLRRDPAFPDRVYKRMRWGRTLDLFVLDCRSERRPSTRTSASAEYLSRAQMDWLKAELSASDAVFKVILNSVPITDCPGLFDLQPQDRWEGYAAQRREILGHVETETITGVLWVAGDFHLCSAGRVSPSGVGSAAIEVLVGPGGSTGNPLALKMRAPQFDFASTTNNYAVLSLDPTATTATIDWVDASGRAFETHAYALG